MSRKTFQYSGVFYTERKDRIKNLNLTYHTYGTLNEKKDNVVWVNHTLTSDSDFQSWWQTFFKKDGVFDAKDYFVICANSPGSCYGSTAPNSWPEGPSNFPKLTIRDIVNSFEILRKELNIQKIDYLIGASFGGQIALEWAIKSPSKIKNLILLATNAKHSPWGIAFNEAQRKALEIDSSFKNPTNENAGKEGLKLARAIALLSYRSYDIYDESQQDSDEVIENHKCIAYQNYQGEKFVSRFDPWSYYYLSLAMDSHNVGRNRGNCIQALKQIKAKTLIIGIANDVLFPFKEQQFLSEHIPNVQLQSIQSDYGHDAILIEYQQIEGFIREFKRQNNSVPNTENIGLIGLGCVGTGFYKLLSEKNHGYTIQNIAVKDPKKKRAFPVEAKLQNYNQWIDRKEIETIVELVSDDKVAYDSIKTSLLSGKKVVSANKKVIAENWKEFQQLEKRFGGKLLYEAAVCAGIPVIRLLDQYYKGEKINGLRGILNGSSNFVLSNIFEHEKSFESAIKLAQEKGFAEVDPTRDLDGFDSKYKLSLLAIHAFGKYIHPDRILNLGISNISLEDVTLFKKLNYKVKLVATANYTTFGRLSAKVLPQLVDNNDQLWNVDWENNAIELLNAFADKQSYFGKGAGSLPTASAVLADLLALKKGYRYSYSKYTHSSNAGLGSKLSHHFYVHSKHEDAFKKLPGTALDSIKSGDSIYAFYQIKEQWLLDNIDFFRSNFFACELQLKQWDEIKKSIQIESKQVLV